MDAWFPIHQMISILQQSEFMILDAFQMINQMLSFYKKKWALYMSRKLLIFLDLQPYFLISFELYY
jgi:isochorismate hydrolase